MPKESRAMSEMPEELKAKRDELASNHAFMMMRAMEGASPNSRRDFKAGFDKCFELMNDENQLLKFALDNKSKEIGRSEHRGNTVDYIYDKCKLYGDQLEQSREREAKLQAKLGIAKRALKAECYCSSMEISDHSKCEPCDALFAIENFGL